MLNVSNEISLSSSQELKEDVNDDEVFEDLLSDVGAAEIKVSVNRYLKSQKGQSYVCGSGNQDIIIFIQGYVHILLISLKGPIESCILNRKFGFSIFIIIHNRVNGQVISLEIKK